MRVALFSFLAYLSTVTADVICVTDFDASASVDFYSYKVRGCTSLRDDA